MAALTTPPTETTPSTCVFQSQAMLPSADLKAFSWPAVTTLRGASECVINHVALASGSRVTMVTSGRRSIAAKGRTTTDAAAGLAVPSLPPLLRLIFGIAAFAPNRARPVEPQEECPLRSPCASVCGQAASEGQPDQRPTDDGMAFK